MSNELGGGDVAGIQLRWCLVDEATETNTIERCARDLLVRSLREIKGGWPASRNMDVQEDAMFCLVSWQSCLRDPRYADVLARIAAAFLDELDLAPGWIPSGFDDPVIGDVFRRFWRDP
jgi:hypothetical protein